MNRLSLLVASVLVILGPLILAGFHGSMFLDPFYLAGPVVGFGLTILLAFRERAWTYLTAGIVVAVVPILFLVMWIWQALLSPLFTTEFIGGWIITLGAFMALWSGIRGFLAMRSEAPRVTVRNGWGSMDGLAFLVPLLFVFGGISAAAMASQQATGLESSAADFAADATVRVTLAHYEFAPGTINVQRGVITEIVVENQDSTFHTFTYMKGGTEYNHDILAGQTVSFLVKFDAAGTFPVRCLPHSDGYDDGMIASIVVT